MRALTILIACTVGIIAGTIALSADAARLKGEDTASGTMCTGPCPIMDLACDYVYGECSEVCKGKDIILVDGIYDCTGSFDKLKMQITLPAEDSSSPDVLILVPVNAIADLVPKRVNRASSAPAKTPTEPKKMKFKKMKYSAK